jgi:hypothetical protein
MLLNKTGSAALDIFKSHPKELKGNNDLLTLTKPEVYIYKIESH